MDPIKRVATESGKIKEISWMERNERHLTQRTWKIDKEPKLSFIYLVHMHHILCDDLIYKSCDMTHIIRLVRSPQTRRPISKLYSIVGGGWLRGQIIAVAYFKLNQSHIKSMLHHIQASTKKFILIIYLVINLEKKPTIIHGKLNQIILINLLIDLHQNPMLLPMVKEWFPIWYESYD